MNVKRNLGKFSSAAKYMQAYRHATNYAQTKRDHANRNTEKDRDRKYWRLYGISYNEYLKMYEHQEGKCAMCRKQFPVLQVDHNHDTGNVRGLLCKACNFILGFYENINWLAKAEMYLTNYPQ